jgi:glycosyltransferase involved in cell wall biosynthesis
MRNTVIQLHEAEYHDFVDYLRELGFERVVLGAPSHPFMSKPQLLGQYLCGTFHLLQQLDSLQDAETVVAFGRFAFAVKLLARLRLVRYSRLFCFGFFVHEPRWFPIFRWLARLDRENDHYVVFSRSEIDLYEGRMGISRERMHFVPLGDWGQLRQPRKEDISPASGQYYFAGGRSNRDYQTLVEAFRSISAALVIICSRSNYAELEGAALPPNVTVLCDVPITVFDDHVRRAKAGIIPLKHDTGASGQSLALSLMRNAKCVIASDVGPLREYVEHGVSGYLLANLAEELPSVIRRIEEEDLAPLLGGAARERYERRFSRATAAEAFEGVLNSVPVLPAA